MTIKLPNRHASRAVLIGSSAAGSPVAAQLARLRDLLTSKEHRGIDEARCAVLLDPGDRHDVDQALRAAATGVGSGGLLLVYYAGPVVVRDGHLWLVLPGTDPDDLANTAVDYAMLRWWVRENGASLRAVVIDAGATGRDQVAIADAAGTDERVHLVVGGAGPDGGAFTPRLLDLLDRGMPRGAHLLTVQALCSATGGTEVRDGGVTDPIPLVRNPALYPAARTGQVLFAATDTEPALADAVVLILRHDEATGTIGVVVNRPDAVDGSAAVLAGSWVAALGGSVVYTGGFARPEGYIPLVVLRPDVAQPQRFREVQGRLGTIALSADPAGVVGAVEQFRVFSGYLGWGPGGLETDIGRDILVPSHVDAAFVLAEDHTLLWGLVQGPA